MCGILGGWLSNLSRSYKNNLAEAMSALKYRGPDDQGYDIINNEQLGQVFLGQTRLSIIDLSDGGHQPMVTEDGRYLMVFNGEIYNYKELRHHLSYLGYDFQTSSDTEVLLKAWVQWGESCLKKLIGMFAFVVYDKHDKKLTCIRDAFGIKPFFYYIDEKSFLFASNQQALLSLRTEKPNVNLKRCYDYLVYADYDSQEQTFIEGVKHLLPGQVINYDLNTQTLSEPTTWWKPSIEQKNVLSFEAATDEVRELFLSNIKLHLRSDVPLGVTLSGGIDSSAVACAMRYIEPELPIHTFSFIAANSPVSEEKWVDQVNHQINAISHKVIVNEHNLAADIDDMIKAQGEPFGSTSIYAQYCVFKLVKEHGIKVTLDGQGADELLAGYQGYPSQRLSSLLEQHKLFQALKFINQWRKWPGRGVKRAMLHAGQSMMPAVLQQLVYQFQEINKMPSWLDESYLNSAQINSTGLNFKKLNRNCGRRVIERLSYSLQQKGLPELLRHGDRNSMRFSIESRVPFLTIPMAERLLSLPEHYLISNTGETKSVFRAAMRGIVPDVILDRRDKIGFSTPEKEWLLSMEPITRNWLQEGSQIPFLKTKPLLEQFDNIMSGKATFSWQVWRWINFVRWYQQVI